MLDYMIEKNHLMPFFEQAGLDKTDIIFIKELIYGELNGQTNNPVSWETKIENYLFSFSIEDLAV